MTGSIYPRVREPSIARVPEEVQKFGPSVIFAYKYLKGRPNPCKPDRWCDVHYGAYYNHPVTGELALYKSEIHVCHSGLRDFTGSEALWTFVAPTQKGLPGKVHPHAEYAWHDYLMQVSPYKGLMVKLPVEFAIKKGYVVHDTDQPANLVANFMVATRQAFENPKHVNLWYRFVESGIHPSVAMGFGFGLGSSDDDMIWSRASLGHSHIDADIMNKDWLSNFYHGKIVKILQPFRESGRYTPCNSVFGLYPHAWDFRQPPVESYREFLLNKYIVSSSGNSGRTFQKHVVGDKAGTLKATWEHWLEIAKAEEERIKQESPSGQEIKYVRSE